MSLSVDNESRGPEVAICITIDELYIKNDEFCIKNGELCIKNDELCIKD